jgi:HemY protein
MLFSLIRVLFFVALVVLLALVARWLMEAEGGMQITVADMEFTLGPLQAVIAAILFAIVVWLAIKVLTLLVAMIRFLGGDETALSRYASRRAQRKGYEALGEGIMALAEGDGPGAMSKASRAQRYLGRPDLTNLITAQAAELSGDRRRAEEVYKELVTDERTKFAGVRGLLRQKLAAGDTDTALRLAEKAFSLRPRHQETQDVLLRLQAEHDDWGGARRTLSAKLKHGALPRDVYRRRDAVLALGEAREILEEGKSIDAREAAIEANKQSPDLVPAAVMAARAYIADEKKRQATRILRKAWEARPHPDLAAAFAEIEPDETPQQRLERFKLLAKAHPEHPETRLFQSELNIAAEDFPAARRALGDLAVREPTARALTNMAAIERGEGAEDHVVRAWLAKALTARRGPQWVCDTCHNVQGEWRPVCSNCSGFDTLAWKEPPAGETQLPMGMEMLPLLVGRPEAEAQPGGAATTRTSASADDETGDGPGVPESDAAPQEPTAGPVPAAEVIEETPATSRGN